jgi:hypothetical protein
MSLCMAAAAFLAKPKFALKEDITG